MKQPRRNQNLRSLPTSEPPKRVDVGEVPSGAAFWQRLMLPVALGLAGIWFLLASFSQPLAKGVAENRWTFMLRLLSPDLIASEWVGGKWSNLLGAMDRWPLLLVGTILLAASFGWGQLLLTWLNLTTLLTRLERFLFSLALGYQLLSLFTFILGLVTLRYPVANMVMILYLLLGILATGRAIAPFARTFTFETLKTTVAQQRWAVILLGFPALLILGGAILPPWDFDVREYHLQVPKEWFQQGQISFLPHNIYGNMPLGGETPAISAMLLFSGEQAWWWGALTGKTLMALFVPLTALALYAWGERTGQKAAGLIAATIYIWHPWAFHLAFNGLNETVYVGHVVLAGYAVWLSWQTASPLAERILILAGLLAGGAASCKYPAVVFAVIPLALAILVKRVFSPQQDSRSGQWLRMIGLFLLATSLSAGPWYVKNWVLAGNPVYPLLGSWFPGVSRTQDKNAQWAKAHAPPGFTLGQAQSSLATITSTGHLTSPLLFPLLVAALASFVLTKTSRQKDAVPSPFSLEDTFPLGWLLAWLAWMLVVWWFATHRLERFLAPAIPVAALLAGVGAHWLMRQSRVSSFIAYGLLTLGLLFQIGVSLSPLVGDTLVGDNRWLVPLATLQTDSTSAAHRWLNENTSPGEAVLLVGDAEPFDLVMPVFYNTCFDSSLLVQWTKEKSLPESRAALADRKIHYIYIRRSEIQRYLSPGNYGYDPQFSPQLIDHLITEGILEPVDAGAPEIEIYRVR